MKRGRSVVFLVLAGVGATVAYMLSDRGKDTVAARADDAGHEERPPFAVRPHRSYEVAPDRAASIRLAWTARPAAEEASPARTTARPRMPPESDAADNLGAYMLGVMRNVVSPLLAQCAELPRDTNRAVVVRFRVEGTEGTGGVVDDVGLAGEDGGPLEPALGECVEQSLLGVILDAPPASAPVIRVDFPFRITADGGAALDLGEPHGDDPE
jgi:hypothetical protein